MNTAVIGWGRLNPPTTGHSQLLQTIVRTAKDYNATPLMYVSQTQNKKKNPLSYEQKIYYIREGLRNGHIVVQDRSVKTLIDLLQSLDDEYDSIVMVGGGDRIGEYRKLLDRYNGVEYEFDSIEYVSAGERDPDAEGIEGMSASKLRDAAKEEDIDLFASGAPEQLSQRQVRQMFNDVRQGMGLETLDEQEKGSTVADRKEYYVKKLKNNEDNFKDRYGEDWKSVMYATATKMAKDDLGLNEKSTHALIKSLIETAPKSKKKKKDQKKPSPTKYVEFNPDDSEKT